jgi:hypothetical protein
VSDSIQEGEEILLLSLQRLKTDVTFAKLATGKDLALQFAGFAEKQPFANADLAPGPNQAFPIVGFSGELAGQQNFDAAAGDGMVRPDSVRAGAFAAAIEPGGKDAGVVEDHEIAGSQQLREVAELAIRILPAAPLQMQHAGTVAGGEGLLRNQVVGKIEVEVGNQHRVRL